MLDFKAYKKINEYLDANKIEELREYLKKEEQKNYVQVARDNLKFYLNVHRFASFCLTSPDELIISNGISIYKLKSKEVLTSYYRKKEINNSRRSLDECRDMVESTFKSASSSEWVLTDGKITDEGEVYTRPVVGLSADFELSGVETTNFHIFRKDNMEFAKCFLGDGVTYKLLKGDHDSTKPIALVESEKGKGLILGIESR